MKIELDIKRLNDSVRRSKIALGSMKDKNDKLTQQFITKAKEELKYIASSAIDKFYEDYEPHWYGRTLDLYNTYRINVSEDEWSIDFSSEWMTQWHRVDDVDPDYIFENSFIGGWHGGAISGEGHPNPGVPYWRVPSAGFFSKESGWIPSLMSPSPYKEIVRKSNIYMTLEIAKYHKAYNSNVEECRRQITKNIERIR